MTDRPASSQSLRDAAPIARGKPLRSLRRGMNRRSKRTLTAPQRRPNWTAFEPGLLILIEELSTDDNTTASVCGATICPCGSCQPVEAGRKFVNQEHYDHSRTLHRDRAQELVNGFREGVTKRQLAKEFGMSHSAVSRLLEKNPSRTAR
jgi:hypothetical protein